MQVLANTDVIISLFYGGLIACAVAGAMLLLKGHPPIRWQVLDWRASGRCWWLPRCCSWRG